MASRKVRKPATVSTWLGADKPAGTVVIVSFRAKQGPRSRNRARRMGNSGFGSNLEPCSAGPRHTLAREASGETTAEEASSCTSSRR